MSVQDAVARTHFPRETRIDILPLEEMRLPAVRRGIDYWNKIRDGRPYPQRDDLRARDIPGLLKHMVLARVLDGAEDFHLKIVGDEVVRSYRAPIINRRMSEIIADLPNTVERWRPLYRRVALSGVPLAVVVTLGMEVPEINFTHAETVCLPFGPEGGPVDYLATFGEHTAKPGLSCL